VHTALKKSVARSFVAVMVLALNACVTVGPDFEAPDVAWLNDWQSDLYGQIGQPEQQTRTDLRFWTQLFNDPVLNELVETARRENPSLRIAGLRVLESRALLGIAGSNRYPQLQQVSAAVAYVNEQQSGGTAPQDQSLTSYQAAFDFGWEPDFWGRFSRAIESANAAYFASITSQQDVQVLLSAQVADLYFAYWTTLLRIDIAQRNVAIQKRSFEITEKIYEAGQGSELDLQQAKTQYLATLSTIPELEATQIQLRNALAALLGRTPGDVPELESVKGDLPAVDPIVIQDIPAQLLLRRPDIRTAAWQIAAQSAQIGVAKADYYPAITLFGSLGWSANSLDASSDTGSLVIGPALTWNVFDHGRIRNNVRLQDARLQQSIEVFQNNVLQAARQIDDAAISVVKTGEQHRVLTAALRAAERSLELANTRYQEGYADFQRVLDAQRALFAQADRELINRSTHISAIIALYTSIGGGWTDMSVEQLVPESLRDQMRSRTNWGDLLSEPLPSDDGLSGAPGKHNE
jgi:NodT family efflux transporter outer membrane factor (OMF) lipoprotein